VVGEIVGFSVGESVGESVGSEETNPTPTTPKRSAWRSGMLMNFMVKGWVSTESWRVDEIF